MRHDHLFIGGQWVESESGEVYTRRDPATGNVVSRHDRATRAEAERAITYSPFLCRGLPRNENGRHRRMLDICCPGLSPGVLLWPICHPTYLKNEPKGLAPSRLENDPYGTA